MNKDLTSYLKFLMSLVVMGFGIALVTKSNLGTSAISSIPYVLSRVFNLTFGTFTLIINTLYFFIQLIVLRENFPRSQYFQVVVGPILGLFIDLSMFLLAGLKDMNYVSQLSVLLIGCVIIGYSIWLQLSAKIVNNPTEGMVNLVAIISKKEFSRIKILFDIFLVIIAAIISYTGLGKVVGIREGTVISAFVVGYVIRGINYIEERR
ncbi:MAG: DUF6198 family protein [Staphylococcus equorum]|uniref:Uncharacterized membrane protein YczE n=3 Tax=Alkalibacterium TaxID=99906 RepID=A0A1H6VWW9_9LACT|nr:DUF6198 family protein [Staphylococcus equorum]SEJ04692.1 Uncharacterized membrane protein YczE [Alkalibacterium gilvum]